MSRLCRDGPAREKAGENPPQLRISLGLELCSQAQGLAGRLLSAVWPGVLFSCVLTYVGAVLHFCSKQGEFLLARGLFFT